MLVLTLKVEMHALQGLRNAPEGQVVELLEPFSAQFQATFSSCVCSAWPHSEAGQTQSDSDLRPQAASASSVN